MPQISLAAARVNANLTQKKAAEMLGICKETLISWEKGKTIPRHNQVLKLSEIYNMPIDYIFLPYNLTKSVKK